MTKMMESAQKPGYNVHYYSPEMRAEYRNSIRLWRAHFNNDLYQGKYTDDYSHYLKKLSLKCEYIWYGTILTTMVKNKFNLFSVTE